MFSISIWKDSRTCISTEETEKAIKLASKNYCLIETQLFIFPGLKDFGISGIA